MIEIVCDNCEQPFKVDPDEVGEKVPCPECGDINRVPTEAGPEDRGLPPEEGPEVDILVVRPAMFRARPVIYSIMVLLFLGGVVGAIYGGTQDLKGLLWPGAIAAAAGLLWWVVWYVLHLGQTIQITNKRTVYRKGLLSRFTSEVLHNHIRNLQIKQTVLQRMLNVGDMVLDSSAGGGDVSAEIRVCNIPRPQHLKEIIDQYRVF